MERGGAASSARVGFVEPAECSQDVNGIGVNIADISLRCLLVHPYMSLLYPMAPLPACIRTTQPSTSITTKPVCWSALQRQALGRRKGCT